MEAVTKKKINKDAEAKYKLPENENIEMRIANLEHGISTMKQGDKVYVGKTFLQKVLLYMGELKEYEDLGYTPEQLKEIVATYEAGIALREGDKYKLNEAIKEVLKDEVKEAIELKKYKQLEEEGRLVRLTLIPGDVVYCVDLKDKIIDESTVLTVCNTNEFEYDSEELYFCHKDIGKTVFLTREEAEKRLQEEISKSPRQRIEEYIKKCGYTYNVQEIIDTYREKYGKAYCSYTMTDTIENNLEALKKLVK
ncbi:MAG: hypothetical protein Q4F05_11350 [bacterium]|nr:hypothetical protein [bacterium]